MKRPVLILILFVVAQLTGTALALLLANRHGLSAGLPLDPCLLDSNPRSYAIGFGAAYVLLMLVLRATRLVRPRPDSALRPRHALWPLVIAGTLGLALGESLLLAPLELQDGGMTARFAAMRADVACVLLLVIVGPVAEEIVFRAGILRALLDRGQRPAVAIAVSALCFAAVHGNAAQAVPAFVTGAVLGWLYVHTGDIRLSVLAHVTNNALALLLLGVPETEALGLTLPPAATVVAGLALMVCGIAALWWWRRCDSRGRAD